MKHSLYLLIALALLFSNMCLEQSDSGTYTQVASLNTADAEIEAGQKWCQPDKVKYATIIAGATATAVCICNPTLRSLALLESAGLALLAYTDDVNARRGGGGFSSSRRGGGGGFSSSSRRSGGKGFSSSSRRSGGSASRKSIKSHTGSKSSSKAKSVHKSGRGTSKKSIKSRTASKSNLRSKGIKPANDNVVTLELGKDERSKIGVENKIRYLQRKAREGKLVVTDTKDMPRNSALTKKARALYAEKHPELDMNKVDIDHKQEKQLGGKDTLRNMALLDRGVNRKIGAQIHQDIKSHNYSYGTPINRVRVIPPKAKPANDNTAREGKLIVTKNSSRSSALTDKIGGTDTEKYPKQNMSNIDWGHRQDLRFDGRDKSSEAQIQQAIRDMPVGTVIRVPFNYLD